MIFNSDDRHILVINGEQHASLEYATQITRQLECLELINQKKAQDFLGQELDAVIFDMHEDFDPNAFGAITGTIRCGGFLILLKPIQFTSNSLFLSRLQRILDNNSKAHYLNLEDQTELVLAKPSPKSSNKRYATPDQENTVAAIVKVVTGHRRRPLVITSDRGRGKSASLGIAAAQLINKGLENIIICAPSKKTASIVFEHAKSDIENIDYKLSFYPPDELQKRKPKADLVLIDEAAAIPMPMLTSFLQHYSRIVFASTQHGYEGCGRGFGINFRKILDHESPQWKSCELNTPIRWNENDTLEQFTFDVLLLNADAAEDSILNNISIDDCEFKQINKQNLVSDNNKLKQLFGLLVSAHYQTKPSDLMQMLDDDSLIIFCLEANETIVAVALVITEGQIDTALAKDIFDGKRRLQGHLVAQALSSNIGIESAICLSGERISRVAVHPKLQKKGLGAELINHIFERSTADYLSTCYGATDPLLSFWQSLTFQSVHLGIKRDASSGSHSVTMLKAKTKAGRELSEQAQVFFNRSFPQLLSDTFNELEPEIVLRLLADSNKLTFDEDDLNQLSAFAHESRGYENSLFLIKELVLSKITDNQLLNDNEKKILVIKVLQHQTWDKIKQKMSKEVSGKKEALALLRKAISKLLES